MLPELLERSAAIEECYEYLLAYAAQGLPTHQGSESGAKLRELLERAIEAISGLAQSCAAAVEAGSSQGPEPYQSFLKVVERDARDSLAAVDLVSIQPSISSQLIDNLNASTHLRALLTDLFLLGEIFRARARSVEGPADGELDRNPIVAD